MGDNNDNNDDDNDGNNDDDGNDDGAMGSGVTRYDNDYNGDGR